MWTEQGAVHAVTSAGVLVELEERLLEARGLDRQVDDVRAGDGRKERTDVALELAGQPAVGRAGERR